ncbi:MAG: hypothetical protein RIB63_12390, partial [Fulvivirga sp.]
MSLVQYLLMSSIGLLLFWLYYYVFLRGKTFFVMNRWYLIGALAISLTVPLASLFITAEQLPAAISTVSTLSGSSSLGITEISREWGEMSTSKSLWSVVIPAVYILVAILLM